MHGRGVLWMAGLAPCEVGAPEGGFVYSGSARDAEDGIAVVLGENLVDNGLAALRGRWRVRGERTLCLGRSGRTRGRRGGSVRVVRVCGIGRYPGKAFGVRRVIFGGEFLVLVDG